MLLALCRFHHEMHGSRSKHPLRASQAPNDPGNTSPAASRRHCWVVRGTMSKMCWQPWSAHATQKKTRTSRLHTSCWAPQRSCPWGRTQGCKGLEALLCHPTTLMSPLSHFGALRWKSQLATPDVHVVSVLGFPATSPMSCFVWWPKCRYKFHISTQPRGSALIFTCTCMCVFIFLCVYM